MSKISSRQQQQQKKHGKIKAKQRVETRLETIRNQIISTRREKMPKWLTPTSQPSAMPHYCLTRLMCNQTMPTCFLAIRYNKKQSTGMEIDAIFGKVEL